MDLMNAMVVGVETSVELQGNLWMLTAIGVVFFAFTNFAYASWQMIPLLGAKGLYSATKKQSVMRQHFTARRRMIHFPSTWFGILGAGYSNVALQLYPVIGMILTLAFMVLELFAAKPFAIATSDAAAENQQILWFPLQVILLWMIWFLHVCFSDLVSMPFPWHSLMNESLLVVGLGYTTMLDAAGVNGGSVYSNIGVLATRVLVFRVLFGFGKFKFQGAKWRDWKYIKGFMPSIPVCNPAGPLFHRYLPDAGFAFAYLMFWVSEIVAPFFYFAPWASWRVAAALITQKLMVGILLTGNFGNFNLLVIVLCVGTPLPVTGATVAAPVMGAVVPWWYATAAAMSYWALVLHMIAGILVLPFNSWVQSSWFGWPNLIHAASFIKKFCAVFEVLQQWRIVQPYGIFPPNAFPAQRNTTLFEGSRDGKTWSPYTYLHQPSEPHHRPSLIPGVHPWLDFNLFYQLGYYGFMQSCTYLTGCLINFECRPIDAVARNLLEGGDVADLFGNCPFPKNQPPTYIRAVQLIVLPAEKGSPDWWSITRGTIELPATSLATMETLIPKVFVTDPLADSEPGLWIWRDRVKGRLDTLNQFMPEGTPDQRALATLRYLATEQKKLPTECTAFIQGAAKECTTLPEVLAYCDRMRYYHEAPALRQGIHKLALLATDVLVTCGWPWSGENKPRMAELRKSGLSRDHLPVSVMQLYLFCLWLLANPAHLQNLKDSSKLEDVKKLLLKQVEGPWSWYQVETPAEPKEQVHDGLRLLVGLFPRTIRLESSMCRRWIALGLVDVERQEAREADLVLPGFQVYWRSLFQKTVSFFPAKDLHLASTVGPDNVGGCWGTEKITQFHWNAKIFEWKFDEVKVNDW